MNKLNLTWGESACVREAFLEMNNNFPLVFSEADIQAMGYPAHEGDERLIAITKDIILRQIGMEYKHVLITNGAAGAVTITLRAYAQRGHKIAVTGTPPFFPVYPGMIKSAGLGHKYDGDFVSDTDQAVILADSPSNPLGLIGPLDSLKFPMKCPIIWDAVYHNMVYTNGYVPTIPHDVVCGSYSKLTGINGIRLGWIATNDSLLYQRLKALVTAEYCGISLPSTEIALRLFEEFDWPSFERKARSKLDFNRGEWTKLIRFFEGKEVEPIGMFYYAKMDLKAHKLFEKAGISYFPGSQCHHDDNYGRFNLGQSPKIISQAVKSVLKLDKVIRE